MDKSPDAFRTISEVADWLDTPAHVFRFWESRFVHIKPIKRAGGRRYYRPTDMLLLGGIKKLLHDDGITIKGVQKILREKGVKHVQSLSIPVSIQVTLKPKDQDQTKTTEKETTNVSEIEKPKGPVADDSASIAASPEETKLDAQEVTPEEPVTEQAADQQEQMDLYDSPEFADGDEAGLAVMQFPESIKATRDVPRNDMQEIEALYYSLKMARNNMKRTGVGL